MKNSMDYSLIDLKKTFKILKNSVYCNVKGCYCIDSKIEGPCVGITIMTHGNEPSGLAAFRYFLDNNIFPEKGKIIFIINNIKAAENFFCAANNSERDVCRFVDINFNRLPENCLDITSDQYEIKRIKEVYPIYTLFDFGLDIHSTRTDPRPLIINISDDLSHGLFSGFPNEMVDIIANMAFIQTGIPASSLFGGKEKSIPILGIETGIHTAERAFQIAILCTLAFCRNCGVLFHSTKNKKKKWYQVYKVMSSVFYPDESFKTIRDFKAFEELTLDTVLGINDMGQKIFAPIEGLSLFGNKNGHKPKTSNDEEFFIVNKSYRILR